MQGVKRREKIAPSRVPKLWGDGIHDDTVALEALCDGEPVLWQGRVIGPDEDWLIAGRRFLLTRPVWINRPEQRQKRRGTLAGNLFEFDPRVTARFHAA